MSSTLHFTGRWLDGRPVQEPVDELTFARRLLGLEPDWTSPPAPVDEDDPFRLPRFTVHPHEPLSLRRTGWGVVLPADLPSVVKTALEPLLQLRRGQAGSLYREASLPRGWDVQRFLREYRAPPGAVDPSRLPYHLLLVGGPEDIPFEVQFQLDQQYAVGRIAFHTEAGHHDVDAYRRYAETVRDAEAGRLRRQPVVSFFGADNGDRATQRLRRDLMEQLVRFLESPSEPNGGGSAAGPEDTWSRGFRLERTLGPDATRAALEGVLFGQGRPAVVLAAGHGIRFAAHGPQEELSLRRLQGGLISSDWRAEAAGVPIPREAYLAAPDVPADTTALGGLVVMLMGCFTAGTPRFDSYPAEPGAVRKRLAAEDFVAALPQRLLAHPEGGALAVIGHVDRTWTSSWDWHGQADSRQPFEDCLAALLRGHSVGSAMEWFGQRYGHLSAVVEDLRDRRASLDEDELRRFGRAWRAGRDARSFVVLGDPAVTVMAPL